LFQLAAGGVVAAANQEQVDHQHSQHDAAAFAGGRLDLGRRNKYL